LMESGALVETARTAAPGGRAGSASRAVTVVRVVLERRANVLVLDVDLEGRMRPVGDLEALEERAVEEARALPERLTARTAEGVADADADRERRADLVRHARH